MPFYYGWVMVPLAAVSMLATLPGRSHGLGLITEPLLAELQIERTTYGHLNFWATLLGSLACLPVGRLLDRFGTRRVATGVLLALGAGVLAMASAGSARQLFAGVLWTRAVGQSALSVASIAMVGKWFERKSGAAMGLYSVLIGLGFATAFRIVGQWVKLDGWRAAWTQVGWAVMGLGPVFWLLARDYPEACGIRADRMRAQSDDATPTAAPLNGCSLSAALRAPIFWLFALATSLFGLVVGGVGLFNESILKEFGFNSDAYREMLVISAGASLMGQSACGIAARRLGMRQLLGVAMLLYAAALVALPQVRALNQLRACTALLGASGGAITVVFFACWGSTFGRAHLGRIQGAAQMLTVLASALGPLLFAEIQSRAGSYAPAFHVLAPLAAGCGIAAWFVRPPVAGAPYNSA